MVKFSVGTICLMSLTNRILRFWPSKFKGYNLSEVRVSELQRSCRFYQFCHLVYYWISKKWWKDDDNHIQELYRNKCFRTFVYFMDWTSYWWLKIGMDSLKPVRKRTNIWWMLEFGLKMSKCVPWLLLDLYNCMRYWLWWAELFQQYPVRFWKTWIILFNSLSETFEKQKHCTNGGMGENEKNWFMCADEHINFAEPC